MTKDQLWQAVLGELELILSKANFSTWFKDTFAEDWQDNRLIVGVPNTFTQSWLQTKYHQPIQAALKNITGSQIKDIVYKVESIKRSLPQTVDALQPRSRLETNGQPKPPAKAINPYGLNPKYKFESFIVGKNNELAHAAARAVAEKPGLAYNPLFIYGGVGLGKTHLLQAIGQAVLELAPQTKVLYSTCEKFTNDFVQAIKNGQTKNFHDYYRDIDILIVDDIHFMVGKDQTQEQFFHTFNELHQNNKQIIISSDRPPGSLPSIEDRLKSRFSWGMIADIGQPDLETRTAILQAKLAEKNLSLDTGIINYLAALVQNNIRELEGSLNRVLAHIELSQHQLSLLEVKELLSGLTNFKKRGVTTAKQIIKEVAEFYEIAIDQILGSSRKKELVVPRQIIMYLIREETSSSFPNIGSEVGQRDHTTVMHACKKIARDLATDEKLNLEINSIKQRLYSQKF